MMPFPKASCDEASSQRIYDLLNDTWTPITSTHFSPCKIQKDPKEAIAILNHQTGATAGNRKGNLTEPKFRFYVGCWQGAVREKGNKTYWLWSSPILTGVPAFSCPPNGEISWGETKAVQKKPRSLRRLRGAGYSSTVSESWYNAITYLPFERRRVRHAKSVERGRRCRNISV